MLRYPYYCFMLPILLSLLLLVLSIILLLRVNRKHKQISQLKELRNHIASDLHDDIGATLTGISFFTQAALSKLKHNKVEEAQTIIEQTGRNAREAVANMNDIVWFINPKNDNLQSLFNRIEDYAQSLFADQHIGFYLYFKDAVLDHKLNMNQRKHLFLLCKEAINNVAKYAQCKNLEILVENQTVIIKDDGIGFNETQMENGNGMANMKYRAHQLGADLKVHSSPQGTFIKLSFDLPLMGDDSGQS